MDRLSEVTISVDSAVFPLSNALITGQNRLDRNARCYIRYKFYDKSKYRNGTIHLAMHSLVV